MRSVVRMIGVGIEDSSREALRTLLPRSARVMKPDGLLVSAGIRADGVPARLPARIARSGPRPHAQAACETRPSRPASYDAAAYRCGGSAGWRAPGEAHALLPV